MGHSHVYYALLCLHRKGKEERRGREVFGVRVLPR